MTSAPNSCCTRSEPVGVVVVTQMRPTPCRAIRLRISGTAASVSPTDTACTQTAIGAAGRTTKPKRSEEHTSELQSLMRISYAVFCLKQKTHTTDTHHTSTRDE